MLLILLHAAGELDSSYFHSFQRLDGLEPVRVTRIHTTDEEGSWVTRCAAEGSTYVCTPAPVGDVDFDLNKQVWHLTGNRPDSLRTYRPDGRLESVEYWSWSSRTGSAIRRYPARSLYRAGTVPWRFNLLGRKLP